MKSFFKKIVSFLFVFFLFYNSICSGSQSDNYTQKPDSSIKPDPSIKPFPSSSNSKNSNEYSISEMRKDAEEIFNYLFEDRESRADNLSIFLGYKDNWQFNSDGKYPDDKDHKNHIETLAKMERFFFIDKIRNGLVLSEFISKGYTGNSIHDVKPGFSLADPRPSKEEYFSSNSTFIMNIDGWLEGAENTGLREALAKKLKTMKKNYEEISKIYPASIFYRTPIMKEHIKKLYGFFFENGKPFHEFIEDELTKNKSEDDFTFEEKRDILDAKYCENLFFLNYDMSLKIGDKSFGLIGFGNIVSLQNINDYKKELALINLIPEDKIPSLEEYLKNDFYCIARILEKGAIQKIIPNMEEIAKELSKKYKNKAFEF